MSGQHSSEVMVILKHIDEKIDRLIWRADQQETQMDSLKSRVTILETKTTAKESSLGVKVQEKSILIFIGILIAAVASKLGIGG